jgi:hypothetical protein
MQCSKVSLQGQDVSAVEKDVATDAVDMVPRGSNLTATVLVAKTNSCLSVPSSSPSAKKVSS